MTTQLSAAETRLAVLGEQHRLGTEDATRRAEQLMLRSEAQASELAAAQEQVLAIHTRELQGAAATQALRSALSSTFATFEEFRVQAAARSVGLERERQAAGTELELQQANVVRLQGDLEQLQDNMHTARKGALDTDTEVARWIKTGDELRTKLADQDGALIVSTQEHERTGQALEESRAECKQFETKLQAAVESAIAEAQKLEGRAAETLAQLNVVSQQNAASKAESASARDEATESLNSNAKLRDQLSVWRAHACHRHRYAQMPVFERLPDVARAEAQTTWLRNEAEHAGLPYAPHEFSADAEQKELDAQTVDVRTTPLLLC